MSTSKTVNTMQNLIVEYKLDLMKRILKGMKPQSGLDPCWIWQGADSGNGYGKISVAGKPRYTHIVAYRLWVGEYEEGLVLDHKCLNRMCCNPGHLKPITMAKNTLIGSSPAALNALKTHCLNGHPFDEINTKIRIRNGRKHRVCIVCRRERRRR